jgi:chlorite dismutase
MVPVLFAAGERGAWRVESISAVHGDSLPSVSSLDRVEGGAASPQDALWTLRGITSSARYVERAEKTALERVQPTLGRPDARRAALIPIRKSSDWWALPQDERRAIFETRSRHIATGMSYLPAVARRLYHCRELGEPFDFLTWFEYSDDQRAAFEDLVARLRETEEWRYVEREVDIRLVR